MKKRIREGAAIAGLPILASFLVGIMGMQSHSDVQYVSPTVVAPTPTYDMTPQGVDKVEGDDGSLGGPVYDQNHRDIKHPHYVFKGSSK